MSMNFVRVQEFNEERKVEVADGKKIEGGEKEQCSAEIIREDCQGPSACQDHARDLSNMRQVPESTKIALHDTRALKKLLNFADSASNLPTRKIQDVWRTYVPPVIPGMDH